MRRGPERNRRGNSIIEVTLMMPWIFFLFVGVFDFGFYSYAAITAQNAARVAAMAGALGSGAPDPTATCNLVVAEMNSLPDTQTYVPGTYVCLYDTPPTNTQRIAINTPTTEVESDGSTAVVITVMFRPMAMIPIPGMFNGPVTIYRTAKAPVLNSAPAG